MNTRKRGTCRACTLVRTMPDDTVQAMELDERCAVVALTHDPKLDDLALMEALKSRAFYVGAIGSRANNAKRRERLREFDLDRRRDRATARADRPLHRQPHAARDRDLDSRRDHGDQERRRSGAHPVGGHREGRDRADARVQRARRNAGGAAMSIAGVARRAMAMTQRINPASATSSRPRRSKARCRSAAIRRSARRTVCTPSSSPAPRSPRRGTRIAARGSTASARRVLHGAFEPFAQPLARQRAVRRGADVARTSCAGIRFRCPTRRPISSTGS